MIAGFYLGNFLFEYYLYFFYQANFSSEFIGRVSLDYQFKLRNFGKGEKKLFLFSRCRNALYLVIWYYHCMFAETFSKIKIIKSNFLPCAIRML